VLDFDLANKSLNFSNISTFAKVIASLARSLKNMKCPLLVTFKHVTVKVQKSDDLKFVFKVYSMYSNASLKMWLLLPNCFMDDHLGEVYQTWLQLDDIMNQAVVHSAHTPAASPRFGSLLGLGQDCWLARELERWCLVYHRLHGFHAPYGQEHWLVSEHYLRTNDYTSKHDRNWDILLSVFDN